MTHEYTLLVGGVVITGGPGPDATAIAWAEDTILALGSDAEVRSISRGDSRFIDLQGAFVVPLAPGAGAASPEADAAWPTDAVLELGGPADLAVVDRDPRLGSDATAGLPPVRTLALVRSGRVVAGWPSPSDAGPGATREIVVAPGIALAMDEWRPEEVRGSPFVLVHGLASNARTWDGVAAALFAAGHAVVTIDQRGHGRSSKPDRPYDVATVAADLASLVEQLGIERPVVAGQSWGGNVVVELAARRPELVRGIACVDGGWLELARDFPDWADCREALAPPRLAGRRVVEIEGYIRTAHPDWPEASIRGVLANFEIRPDGTVAPWLTFDRHIKVLRGLWEHHPSELYAGLTVPVLLTPADGGGSDRMERKRRDVETAASIIPTVETRWFLGDHDIHAQHPAELAGVMHHLDVDGFFG